MNHQGTARFQVPQARQAVESANEMVCGAMESARDAVVHNPASAVFCAFGAGLGLGVGLALVFGGRPEPQYIDPSLRDKITRMVGEYIPWARS